MSDNPFLDTLNKRQKLAPSQNYGEHLDTLNTENPFFDHFGPFWPFSNRAIFTKVHF